MDAQLLNAVSPASLSPLKRETVMQSLTMFYVVLILRSAVFGMLGESTAILGAGSFSAMANIVVVADALNVGLVAYVDNFTELLAG